MHTKETAACNTAKSENDPKTKEQTYTLQKIEEKSTLRRVKGQSHNPTLSPTRGRREEQSGEKIKAWEFGTHGPEDLLWEDRSLYYLAFKINRVGHQGELYCCGGSSL